ncbi:putative F-box/FBD/LRR-repeat protein At5g22670 isoform X2 [Andrographis paniculata]|nr:putative F-box/FBD/LRR-repeat protein At5g22670 isoform X2 [Andrographis paniculata]
MDPTGGTWQYRRRRTGLPQDDRLSALPDDVLHRILSRLDFLDVVRTCVLSRRWRYLWASSPNLNFDVDWFHRHNTGKFPASLDLHRKFWDFIKWCLLMRDEESQLTRLCVSINCTMAAQLNMLLQVAGKRRVRELQILNGDYSVTPLNFPRHLCESLTKLTLNFRDDIPIHVSSKFCNLTSLHLTRVGLPSCAISKIFSSDCIKLEEIHLEDCQIGNVLQIDIIASHLKYMTIVNVSTTEGALWYVGSFDTLIKISAPNLLSFSYVGPLLRGLVFEDTTSLDKVTIRLLRVPIQSQYKNHLYCPARFIGLNHAKTLILSSFVVKHFSRAYNNVSWDSFILDKVTSLEVEIKYSAFHIDGLVNLMKFTPNLETLFIRFKVGKRGGWSRTRKRKGYVEIPWVLRVEDIPCLSHQLEVIRISHLNGEENALELLKFLLLNGRVLKKMEIPHVTNEVKRRYFSKSAKLDKASSDVVISFPKPYIRAVPWFDKYDSDAE